MAVGKVEKTATETPFSLSARGGSPGVGFSVSRAEPKCRLLQLISMKRQKAVAELGLDLRGLLVYHARDAREIFPATSACYDVDQYARSLVYRRAGLVADRCTAPQCSTVPQRTTVPQCCSPAAQPYDHDAVRR